MSIFRFAFFDGKPYRVIDINVTVWSHELLELNQCIQASDQGLKLSNHSTFELGGKRYPFQLNKHNRHQVSSSFV